MSLSGVQILILNKNNMLNSFGKLARSLLKVDNTDLNARP